MQNGTEKGNQTNALNALGSELPEVPLPGWAKLQVIDSGAALIDMAARSGVKTSEFWKSATLLALMILADLHGDLPASVAAPCATVLVIAYLYFRSAVKRDAARAVRVMPPVVVAQAGEPLRGAASPAVDGDASTSLSMTKTGAAVLIALALVMTGCGTTVKEGGKTVLYVPANAKRVEFRTRWTRLTIDELDHAAVHKAVGSSVANAAAGTGAGVATSGIFGLLH